MKPLGGEEGGGGGGGADPKLKNGSKMITVIKQTKKNFIITIMALAMALLFGCVDQVIRKMGFLMIL